MKPKTLLLALLAFVLLTASECKKEDLTTLPPETQEGKNTFGCLINGEVFTRGKIFGLMLQVTARYWLSDKQLRIESHLSPTGNIYMYMHNPVPNQQLQITSCYYSPNDGDYSKCFYFGGKNTGEIIFTKLDTVNLIVSGRFKFDAQCVDAHDNVVGDSIVNITEGRFDIKLRVYE